MIDTSYTTTRNNWIYSLRRDLALKIRKTAQHLYKHHKISRSRLAYFEESAENISGQLSTEKTIEYLERYGTVFPVVYEYD